MDLEIWADVVGYEGYYQVSTHGRVKSVARWKRSRGNGKTFVPERILSTNLAPTQKYAIIQLCRDGKIEKVGVGQLVLTAFSGPCPEGEQLRHLNGNPTDNCLLNLAWGTAKENAADRVLHGTHPIGEKNPRAKLTVSIVLEMRRLYSEGVGSRELSERYGTPQSTVKCVLYRHSWRHI